MKTYINKIETLGLVDGPGIRTVVFFQGCKLRCNFCHNPETWNITKDTNYDIDSLFNKILRSKPYFGNNGGVTFSGGEPLLHKDFLIELCKKLKKENIHIAIDTSGIGNGNYKELLDLVDLVLLDVKAINKSSFKDITNTDYFDKYLEFINELNNSNKEVWIRQVIIPGINDNKEYIKSLKEFITNNIKNVTKVEFLPFHTMAFTKYKDLNIKNNYIDIQAMDKEKCIELEKYYNEI
jgi:pyruvate formate lyase activating enzyme